MKSTVARKRERSNGWTCAQRRTLVRLSRGREGGRREKKKKKEAHKCFWVVAGKKRGGEDYRRSGIATVLVLLQSFFLRGKVKRRKKGTDTGKGYFFVSTIRGGRKEGRALDGGRGEYS